MPYVLMKINQANNRFLITIIHNSLIVRAIFSQVSAKASAITMGRPIAMEISPGADN